MHIRPLLEQHRTRQRRAKCCDLRRIDQAPHTPIRVQQCQTPARTRRRTPHLSLHHLRRDIRWDIKGRGMRSRAFGCE